MKHDKPLGVFDSGLGGLTVVSQIKHHLPNEHVRYLGDTARVPYGARTPATVIKYAQACARRLMQEDVKMIVVACNTVSAVALDHLREEFDVPILGVIEPGAEAAVKVSSSHVIGVLATLGTVLSDAYPSAISKKDPRAQVFQKAAPMLVPLVEEGWTEGPIPEAIVRTYLKDILDAQVDTLVLGCTHYPLLSSVFDQEAKGIRIVDSAKATAIQLQRLLGDRELLRTWDDKGTLKVMVTDHPARFSELASRFLGEPADSFGMELVDL